MIRPIEIRVIPVIQPIGDFYVGVIDFRDLVDISKADMRRIEDGSDRFVGIQRKLRADRVYDISRFVKSIDATFPTSVVVSVSELCASYDEGTGKLTLQEAKDENGSVVVSFEAMANILDGQHRIEGLKVLTSTDIAFELPISIFIDPDASDEAYIFATVNLAQTKVNKSLVYDLLDYAKARSPQKSCHDVAVALDKFEDSPLLGMIKRLGTATPGKVGETLAQATVVTSLLELITSDADGDRYTLARGKSLSAPVHYAKTPLRPMWLEGADSDIARTLINYFASVKTKWPEAWATREKGHILPRTNGFRALMRFLRNALLHFRRSEDVSKKLISVGEFQKLFEPIRVDSEYFTVDNYAPGTSGETALYKDLRSWTGI
jgi:DGQHR domain-containing protein